MKRCYWICATPRTGATLLCQYLRATGIAGRPEEYLWRDNEPLYSKQWKVLTYADYIECMLEQGTTPNGVFGLKLDAGIYLQHIENRLRSIPRYSGDLSLGEIVQDLFPDLHIIWVTRRNKIRQAVSWWKAVQTNAWALHKGESVVNPPHLEYHFPAIDHLANESIFREAAWQDLFSEWKITPLTLVYEDWSQNPAQTITRIMDFLGITEPFEFNDNQITMVKQADELSEEWVQRYRSEKQQHWQNRAW
jgi:LPS sulfotransferase NodH